MDCPGEYKRYKPWLECESTQSENEFPELLVFEMINADGCPCYWGDWVSVNGSLLQRTFDCISEPIDGHTKRKCSIEEGTTEERGKIKTI